MCPEESDEDKTTIARRRIPASKVVEIENLADLDPYTDTIIDALNADKRLLLLAISDPVGVLKDLGYRLLPQAARELRHNLPRLSREQRSRYLKWLAKENIPQTFNIQLERQKSGLGLLKASASSGAKPKGSGNSQVKWETISGSKGQGTGGFDVVAQFGQAFCERMLKRDYAFGYLPRSVYRINNSLKYLFSSGEYDSSFGTADREIHFNQPTLTFPTNKVDTARVTSAFVAAGFTSLEIKGTVSVDSKLSVKKDSQGQPMYVEPSFSSLTAADVTVKVTAGSPTSTISSDLGKMVLDAYKGFSNVISSTSGIPLTFMLVDSSALKGKGNTVQLTATAGTRKPSGASEPLLIVGAIRSDTSSSGDLDSVPCAIKSGGDYAMVQDSGWLEKGLNKSFNASLPVYFDQDSGQVDPNGNFRIDTITWNYRKGGLSGHVDATLEDATPGINAAMNDFQVHLDVTFHSSDPCLRVEGTMGSPELDCFFTVLGFIMIVLLVIAVALGVGYLVAASSGEILLGLMFTSGLTAGGIFGAVKHGKDLFEDLDSVVCNPNESSTSTQEVKLTHTQTLPETGGKVTVTPNDYTFSEEGTLMSAQVSGPSYTESKPSVMIKGTFSADIDLTGLEATSGESSTTTATRRSSSGMSIAGVGNKSIAQSDPVISSRGTVSNTVGTVSLDYVVVSTSGLQGKLTYLWSFNGKSIGTSSSVKEDVPVTADMVKGFEYNNANELGVISVTVTDSFGRTGTASETITVGNQRDLRSFVPHIYDQPGFIDPIERVGQTRYGDPTCIVGWYQEGSAVAQQLGALKSMATITINGKSYVVIGTQKV